MKIVFIHLLVLLVSVTLKTDLYVDPSKPNNFNTGQEDVSKAASIKPGNESDREIIHIAPGTYRQQVMVQIPYVSFVNDETSKEVILTWYYGIYYKNFSCGSKGYYDAGAAQLKTT